MICLELFILAWAILATYLLRCVWYGEYQPALAELTRLREERANAVTTADGVLIYPGMKVWVKYQGRDFGPDVLHAIREPGCETRIQTGRIFLHRPDRLYSAGEKT